MPAVARRDRGAVSVLVAILLSSGVLLGFMAYVVDIGIIYAEREELVTGADAAALAVGKACANNESECTTPSTILSLVQRYADANAGDGAHHVEAVCGRLPGRLADCGDAPANLTRCIGAPPPDPEVYVEVWLSSEVPDGRLVLPSQFAQAMPGTSFDGTAVRACARVSWEPAKVLALTVSTCERAAAPTAGAGPYVARDEYVIDFKDGSFPACRTRVSPPWVTPDNAGWLDNDGQCFLDLPGRTVWGDDLTAPAFRPPLPCASSMDDLIAAEGAVWVVVHDAHQHNGDRIGYRVWRLAKFVVTGYYFGGSGPRHVSSITGDLPCQSSFGQIRRCVSGVFVGTPQPLSSFGTDSIVKLIG